MKKILLAVSILLGAAATGGGWYGYHSFTTPSLPIRIFIPDGQSFQVTAQLLAERGIIANKTIFILWARLSGKDRRIKGGEYIFTVPLTPLEVMRRLVSGDTRHRSVTIPEGMTVQGIAGLLAAHGLGSRDSFLCLNKDPEFLFAWGLPPEGLEGYLYPDTYQFSPSMAPQEIVARMVERFYIVFNAAMHRRAQELGLSLHQVVTLASLIEKETGAGEERFLVSAVFHNRLRRGLPLQSDPTVIYGLQNFSGNLTRHDLLAPTLYNTYTFCGLPPGPIANSGLESLLAALNPAPVDYLYFVAKGNRQHYFSSSLYEHNRAVSRFQRGRL
jgi:UPF0755 protein